MDESTALKKQHKKPLSLSFWTGSSMGRQRGTGSVCPSSLRGSSRVAALSLEPPPDVKGMHIKFCFPSTLWETRIPPAQMGRRPFPVSLSFYPPLLVYAWFLGELRTHGPSVCSEQLATRCQGLPGGRAQGTLGRCCGWSQCSLWGNLEHFLPWGKLNLILKPQITEMGVFSWAPPGPQPPAGPAVSAQSRSAACAPFFFLPLHLMFPLSVLVEVLQVLREFVIIIYKFYICLSSLWDKRYLKINHYFIEHENLCIFLLWRRDSTYSCSCGFTIS